MKMASKKSGVLIVGIVVIAVLATGFIWAININKTSDNTTNSSYNQITSKQDSESLTESPKGGKGNEVQVSYLEQLPATDKLVLYRTPFNKWLLDPAVNIFRQKYPDVDVEIKDFENNMSEYWTLIRTEIPAGKGPDLFFTEAYDSQTDYYKAMDTGLFYDLNNLIQNDSDFNLDDYNKIVMDSGIYKGKRYLMPISYETRMLITTEAALSAAEMDIEKLRSFDGLHSEIKKYLDKYASKKPVYSYSQHYLTFFPWSGAYFIDYESRKTNVAGDDFKKVMEAYKDYYKQAMESTYIHDAYGALLKNEIVFTAEHQPWWTLKKYIEIAASGSTPVILPFPNVNGKTTAQVYDMLFILNSSPNKANAYNFMKILLSEEIQGGSATTNGGYFPNLPVLNKALDMQFESILDMYVRNSKMVSEENIRRYFNMMTDINDCKIFVLGLMDTVYENYMKSYLNGTESYEKFLNKLQNFLELYISE